MLNPPYPVSSTAPEQGPPPFFLTRNIETGVSSLEGYQIYSVA